MNKILKWINSKIPKTAHTTENPMTVGYLKKKLKYLPNDMKIKIINEAGRYNDYFTLHEAFTKDDCKKLIKQVPEKGKYIDDKTLYLGIPYEDRRLQNDMQNASIAFLFEMLEINKIITSNGIRYELKCSIEEETNDESKNN